MYSARPSVGMITPADCANAQRYPIQWRGVRAAEGARLESVYTAKPRIEGSNPSLSATGLFGARLWRLQDLDSTVICTPLFNGDLRRFPRDDSLQTPPGPEGSNGSE